MQYKVWLSEWLEFFVKTSSKERTYKKYRQQAEKYILPALGTFEICDLSAIKLQKFSASLSMRGLSPSSVNFVVALLRSSLKKCVELGIAERQFAGAIVRPKAGMGRVSCFTMAEQKKIENYILSAQKPLHFGILLCLYSGLRIGELLALTWDDVDLKRGTLTVSKSCHDSWVQNHYFKVLDTPKTSSSERIIPLPRQIVARMKVIKKAEKSRFVVVGKSEYGAQVRSYQRTFDNLLKKLNIPHRGFHALRHTFATRALEVGMDVKTLSEILGHKDASVTLRRYAHSLMEHKTEMMNKIGRLLG